MLRPGHVSYRSTTNPAYPSTCPRARHRTKHLSQRSEVGMKTTPHRWGRPTNGSWINGSFASLMWRDECEALQRVSEDKVPLPTPLSKSESTWTCVPTASHRCQNTCGKILFLRSYAASRGHLSIHARIGSFWKKKINANSSASFAPRRRRVAVALQSLDKDVKNGRQPLKRSWFEPLMRKTCARKKVDKHQVGRTQYQRCWKNTMPSLIWCPCNTLVHTILMSQRRQWPPNNVNGNPQTCQVMSSFKSIV